MLDIEKKKARKSGLGGSDIAAIIGLSPWATAMDIYLDKISPDVKEDKPTKSQERGHQKEEEIARRYAERTGNTVSIEDKLITHPEHSFAIGNIDRWVNNGDFILECKTTHWRYHNQWGEQYTDQIPSHYLCQVAWYAFVCDKPKVDIAVLIGDENREEFRIYTYIRNKDFETKLFTIARKFWYENVLAKKPPIITSAEDAAKLYKSSNNEEIIATEEVSDKVMKLWNLKNQITNLDNEIRNLEADIKAYMGENSLLNIPGKEISVTWKQTKPRTMFDADNFKKIHPELYKDFLKEGKAYRTFLIKNKGNENE